MRWFRLLIEINAVSRRVRKGAKNATKAGITEYEGKSEGSKISPFYLSPFTFNL